MLNDIGFLLWPAVRTGTVLLWKILPDGAFRIERILKSTDSKGNM